MIELLATAERPLQPARVINYGNLASEMLSSGGSEDPPYLPRIGPKLPNR